MSRKPTLLSVPLLILLAVLAIPFFQPDVQARGILSRLPVIKLPSLFNPESPEAIPGGGHPGYYVIGSPMFPHATLRLPGGELHIEAEGASAPHTPGRLSGSPSHGARFAWDLLSCTGRSSGSLDDRPVPSTGSRKETHR